MEKRPERAGCSSVLILTNCALSGKDCAASSKEGAIERQGPHHGAQKSAIISRSSLSIKRSNVSGLRGMGFVSSNETLQCPQEAFE